MTIPRTNHFKCDDIHRSCSSPCFRIPPDSPAWRDEWGHSRSAGDPFFPLDIHRNLQYSNHRLPYEARRKVTLPPRSGRHAPRTRPRTLATRDGPADPKGTREIHQPELPLADRERRAAAPDEFDAHAAGAVF